jgi:predicted unusual protein kinase regulating ubiquinone biosynthesis (AarF/ABC1/UbiB family)
MPELLFAIAMAPRLSRWSPEHPEGNKYDKLKLEPSQEYHVTLQSTLDWLASHGLKWGDVHAGNIMIRPKTNDIVFIDFGLYAKASRQFALLKI